MAKSTTKADEPEPKAPGPDDLKSEQEKNPNPGPLTDPVEPGPKAAVNPVTAAEPYPTGSQPDPEDAFFAAHGFRRAKE